MSAATELSQPDFVFSARESHSAAKWARRSKTVPALLIAFFLVWLLLPVLFTFSFIHDLIRDREFSTTRLTLFGAWWLTMEMLGVVTAFILWLIFLPSTKSTSTKSNRWHNRLQCLWAKSLTAGAKRTIGLRWSAEGISCLRPKGPLIILARHGSQGDALLTAALLSNEGRRLRFVLKKQLLNDPCLDIVGHRIPNYFVNRDSLDNQEELANISVLASGLEDDEALVIFPEGTRFSPSKLTKAIDTLTAQRSLVKVERRRACALARHSVGASRRLGDSTRRTKVTLSEAAAEGYLICTQRRQGRGPICARLLLLASVPQIFSSTGSTQIVGR